MGDSPSPASAAAVTFSMSASPAFTVPCGPSTPSSSDSMAKGSPFISMLAIG